MDPRHTSQRGMQARPAVDEVSDCVVAARRLWEDECNLPLRALCHAQHAAKLRQRLGVCDAGHNTPPSCVNDWAFAMPGPLFSRFVDTMRTCWRNTSHAGAHARLLGSSRIPRKGV